MLKITIDNEEVVSNKGFSISEEMLGTSSTILTTCYPKSWELDKDYTSRFYYPEDYSKCVIIKQKPILPLEYTQVEYIESNGLEAVNSSYIDTGYNPNTNTKIELDYQFISAVGSSIAVLGERVVVNDKFAIWVNNNDKTAINFGSYDSGFVANTNPKVRNKISNVNANLYYNGVAVTSTSDRTFTSSHSMYIFGLNAGGSCDSRKQVTRLYSLKIYDNDVLVRNFIPCYRNHDKEIGLYDLVNNVFYTNKGIGKFSKGNKNVVYEDFPIFSGLVKNTADISLNPREPKYCSIQILDNKTLLSEGDCLDFVISNKTILEAIQMVVDAVSSYGFVLGNVNILNPNEIIGTYSTLNKTAYDVFQYLADISGAKWSTRVIDDSTRAIDFCDPLLMPRAQNIEYSNAWAEENNIVDIKFRYGTYDYRNKQVILSDKVQGDINYTETFIADSYTRTFNVSTPINKVLDVLVDGVSVSVASEKAKDIGVYANFYYKVDSTQVSSNDSNEPYSNGTVIQIIYNPLIKGRQMVINENEVSRVSNNLSLNGIISRYENRNDVENSDKLLLVAETYLRFKGQAEIILTITTQDKDLFEVGQVTYFDAPINELATDYMVKTKQLEIISVGESYDVFYTYELSSSFNSERAVNWFDNQRNKMQGNIEDGDFISRNIDINNSANVIWDNLQINEFTIDDSYPFENTLESGIETILEG